LVVGGKGKPMEFLIVAVVLGFIPGLIARGKGRSFGLWWLYGFLIFVVALPHALLLKASPEQVERKQTAQGLKKCPFCAEVIKLEAKVCRYCGKEADSSPNLGTLKLTPSRQKPPARRVGLVVGGVVAGIVLLAVLGQILSPPKPAATSAASTPQDKTPGGNCPNGTVWTGAGCISQTVRAGSSAGMLKSTQEALRKTRDQLVITKTMYDSVAMGMTGEEIESILGRAGEELSRSDIAGFTTTMHVWQNRDGGNVNVMIQNGRVVSKAQFGLK
jgi:RNA polymerase subunit RPABC4/transcription elongation factor Spt4